jgi:hypothetical protein
LDGQLRINSAPNSGTDSRLVAAVIQAGSALPVGDVYEVLVVDDHVLFRQLVKSLRNHSDYEVVGEAGSVEGLKAARSSPISS